jgi:DNA-binding response OmpR family regulator
MEIKGNITQTEKAQKIIIAARDAALVDVLTSSLSKLEIRTFTLGRYDDENNKILELVNKWPPDVILIDLMMPAMFGIKIMCFLRQYTRIPTILLTNWKTNKNKIRLFDIFSPKFLTKPFDAKVVGDKIYDIASRRSLTAFREIEPNVIYLNRF